MTIPYVDVTCSMINTVLPTPAPPNNPTFHHFKIGASKSTTLIQVSKTSAFVERLTNLGADL